MKFPAGSEIVNAMLGMRYPDEIVNPSAFTPPDRPCTIIVTSSTDQKKSGPFWNRHYKPCWLAKVIADSSFESTGVFGHDDDRLIETRYKVQPSPDRVQGTVVGPFNSKEEALEWIEIEPPIFNNQADRCIFELQQMTETEHLSDDEILEVCDRFGGALVEEEKAIVFQDGSRIDLSEASDTDS